MSFRTVAITVTVASFSLTLAVSLWHEHGRRQQERAAVAAPTTDSPVTVARAQPVVAPPQPEAQAAPSVSQAHPVVTSEEEAKPQSFSQVPVPAYILLRPTIDQSAQAATLRNSTSRTLEVSVTASNPASGHQVSAQVMLAPFKDVDIDEATFVIQKGDLLTLRSPPFADRQIDPESESAF